MVTTKEADEIIDAVLERVEIVGRVPDNVDVYPDLSTSERNKLINIIKDIIGE